VAAFLSVLIGMALPTPSKPPLRDRLVFVGDSITDGHTLPLLVRQAFVDARGPVPVVLNAGVAGDTAAGMRKRLARDVLSRRPTFVLFSAGINDVLRGVKVADYAADVSAVAEELGKKKVPLILLTTTTLGPKHPKADARLADFNAAVRRVAKKHGLVVAEVNALMRKGGPGLLEPDQVHLTFAGYRVMARAVLDALGRRDFAVPKELKLEVLPGVVRSWKVRALKGALDEKAVRALAPDASWKALELPQKGPLEHWWQDQERRRGFAQGLDKLAGPAPAYVGVAVVESPTRYGAFLNTGAQLEEVWLNGARVYRSEGWTGWHAGKERVPIVLREGRNVLVIRTGPAFFVSITDWEE
jgi:acyl-CoA thioesterase-1